MTCWVVKSNEYPADLSHLRTICDIGDLIIMNYPQKQEYLVITGFTDKGIKTKLLNRIKFVKGDKKNEKDFCFWCQKQGNLHD